MAAWANFLMAAAGASAALAGLIFVSVSLNLSKVMSVKVLPDRALEALTLLIGSLVISALLLVPGQSFTVLGCELLILGSLIWFAVGWLHRRILRNVLPEHRNRSIVLLCVSQCAVVCYPVCGAWVLWVGPAGLYFLVPGILLSIVKAMVDAWVLLVEVNR